MTVKEWIEEEQGKHFCQCGCGGEIIIKKEHHHPSRGVPNYIKGHKKEHHKVVGKWIEDEQGEHFCQCGCGREIKIIKQHHSRGIPKYINGHGNMGRKFSHANEWIKREQGLHFCQCGCGAEISIKTYHYYHGVPKYIAGHNKGVDNAHPFGKKHPMFGKHHSEETKEKIGQALTGHSVLEATKQKIREKRKHRKFPKHHTKPECVFEEICKKYDLHFKYVGDSSLWIGKKNNSLNPDFIQADGEKIVVEIFGAYWHSLLINPKLPKTANLDYRKKHYKKYGWVSYFIWDTDLLRHDAEQFVLNMLKGVDTPK